MLYRRRDTVEAEPFDPVKHRGVLRPSDYGPLIKAGHILSVWILVRPDMMVVNGEYGYYKEDFERLFESC